MPDRGDNRRPGETQETGEETTRQHTHSSVHQHLDTDALSAFIDDRLDGDLRVAADLHVAGCDDCRRELAELTATVDLLRGLPQYRPQRSFALGSEFAHPVRTSRLARLLPLLPTFRAAAAACLLLLLVVGAGDVLTQIGDDAGDQNAPSSVQENSDGNAAFRVDEGQPEAGGPNSGETGGAAAPAGDGTGGQSTDGSSEAPNPETGTAPENDADVSTASERLPSADEAESAAEAPAPAAAPDSASGDVGESNDQAVDEPAGDADVAADSAADTETSAEEPAASDTDAAVDTAADEAAPAGDALLPESASDDAEQSSAAVAPGAAADGAAPETEVAAVPTIGISTEPINSNAPDSVAQAETSVPVEDAQRANATAERGISNWRLIEIILAVLLAVLAGLVVFLHRLRNRARRTGFIR